MANSAIESVLMDETVYWDKIEKIDNKNIGVIEHKIHLIYGLQQFLLLKHNCSLTSVSNISSYLSNIGFFKLYINKNKSENNIN